MPTQITGNTTLHQNVCSGKKQINNQVSTFMTLYERNPLMTGGFPYKGPVMLKTFPPGHNCLVSTGSDGTLRHSLSPHAFQDSLPECTFSIKQNNTIPWINDYIAIYVYHLNFSSKFHTMEIYLQSPVFFINNETYGLIVYAKYYKYSVKMIVSPNLCSCWPVTL